MKRYIFGKRNGIYIIDLQKTSHLLDEALEFARSLGYAGRKLLFVGTKRQAQDVVAQEAIRCGQYYVTHRWLGGMLTNFVTIRNSIDRLQEIEDRLADEETPLLKKEKIRLDREYAKTNRNLEGIRGMDGLPEALFVVDPKREHIAVGEANKLGIPVIAIVDTNCDPEEVDYVIPGNDDAIRTIRLFAAAVADAYVEGSRGLAEAIEQAEKDAEPEEEPVAEDSVSGGPGDIPVENAAPEEEPAADFSVSGGPGDIPVENAAPEEEPVAEAAAEAAEEAEGESAAAEETEPVADTPADAAAEAVDDSEGDAEAAAETATEAVAEEPVAEAASAEDVIEEKASA